MKMEMLLAADADAERVVGCYLGLLAVSSE